MLKFNHGLFDIKEACGLTDEDIKNYFEELENARENSKAFSILIEKIEKIISGNPVYLRCAVFHIIMLETTPLDIDKSKHN